MKKKDKNNIEGVVKKKNIIMRHKLLFLICFLAFVVLIILFYIFFSLFVGGSDPYGDRLKGINKVNITEKFKKEVVSSLKEKDEVVDASVRVQGKIIYVHIIVKGDVALDKARGIASESLGKFNDDEKKFYDFGYFLSQDKDGGFIATGTKNSNSDHIVWNKG